MHHVSWNFMVFWIYIINIWRKHYHWPWTITIWYNDRWDLIGIPDKPDGTLSDHEYFCIHDDLFDRIQSTNRDRNIMWKFISNEPDENESKSEATETHDTSIQNMKRSITKKSTKHTLQRKRQKSQLPIEKIHLMTSC